MALASAKRFVEKGIYVFITGRRQEQLDKAIKLIGGDVAGRAVRLGQPDETLCFILDTSTAAKLI